MARYSKITKISDVIDQHFWQNEPKDPRIDVIGGVLSHVIGTEIFSHITHFDIQGDALHVTVDNQSIRQLLQLQTNNIIQSISQHNSLPKITKVKILFDT